MGIVYFFVITVIGHIAVWFQCNGQLLYKSWADNPMVVALIGLPVSYAFIQATRVGYDHFGQLWPLRIIGFSVGTAVFGVLTMAMMGEGLTAKTMLLLGLCAVIIIIQIAM
tara:strand:+ start:1148 stop:1480 length:333 start_codon:yes stop_codon:yes gene_type:complete